MFLPSSAMSLRDGVWLISHRARPSHPPTRWHVKTCHEPGRGPSSSFWGRALREHRRSSAPSLPLFREWEDGQAARPPLVRQNQMAAQNWNYNCGKAYRIVRISSHHRSKLLIMRWIRYWIANCCVPSFSINL